MKRGKHRGMKPWRKEFIGTWEEQQVDSAALKGNPLGDPTQRTVWVYLPPAYAEFDITCYPSIYVIQGFTGQVDKWWNRTAFQPTFPERVDALFALPDVPPAIVILVDAWTALGGSQFVNSPGTGRYLDYLCDDVVSLVDREYRTLPDPGHRALAGHSSGGYGAMIAPMLRPDVFGALATHAGDALFEYCYLPDIAAAARAIVSRYDGQIDAFWADFRAREPFTRREDFPLLNVYAMSACYSAEPDGTATLPFDPASGRLRDDVWQRWLVHDPVRMVAHRATAVKSLRAIYIDAGSSDEHYLDMGARAFAVELDTLGVSHRFELFEGGHNGTDWRYPEALRFLAERLTVGETDTEKVRRSSRDTLKPTPEQQPRNAMNRPRKLIVETDGASRGNPGLAGAGVIIKDDQGHTVERIHKFLGRSTSNQAEYQALIEGLMAVARHEPAGVTVRMDSELVVNQMNGAYRVRHPAILPLYARAMEVVATLPAVTFVHVPRERNPGADKLANLAIDSRMTTNRGPSTD